MATHERAPTMLDVNALEHSPRVKVRSGLHGATIARYCEAFESGAEIDPVDVFRENGTERYLIADGSHRLEAAKRAKKKTIAAIVHDGDETAALKFALRSNTKHGLLRRDGDVQACIRSLIMNASLSGTFRTHQERAELLGMSYKTFQRHFAKWRTSSGGSDEEQDAKEKQQQKAEKTTPARTKAARAAKSSSKPTARPSQEDADKINEAHRAYRHAAVDRDIAKRTAAKVAKRAIAHAERLELQRAFATLAACEFDPEEVAVACGIPAKNIERALDFVRNVRENL